MKAIKELFISSIFIYILIIVYKSINFWLFLAILIVVLFGFIAWFVYKLNKNNIVAESEDEDDESVSEIYNSEEDLEFCNDNDKAILKSIGHMTEKLYTYQHCIIATEEEVKENSDSETIIFPLKKINILFYTDYQIFENLEFKNDLVLTEFTTQNSGFTEFEIINEICKFYRTYDKDRNLEYRIIEALEIFKSNDGKITIAFITGS